MKTKASSDHVRIHKKNLLCFSLPTTYHVLTFAHALRLGLPEWVFPPLYDLIYSSRGVNESLFAEYTFRLCYDARPNALSTSLYSLFVLMVSRKKQTSEEFRIGGALSGLVCLTHVGMICGKIPAGARGEPQSGRISSRCYFFFTMQSFTNANSHSYVRSIPAALRSRSADSFFAQAKGHDPREL